MKRILTRGVSSIEFTEEIMIIPDYNVLSMRGVLFQEARNMSNSYVKTILDMVPIQGNHTYIYVDIKLNDLKKGQSPSLNEWHIDSLCNPSTNKEEVNHLFVSDDISLTEFINEDMALSLQDYLARDLSTILQTCPYYSTSFIKPRRIYTYGRSIHRSTPAKRDGKRILIKVTETDLSQPSIYGFKPVNKNGKLITKNN